MSLRSTAKTTLLFMNSLFFILGAVVLGLGIFLVSDKSLLLSVLGNFSSASTLNATAAAIDSIAFLENGSYMLMVAGGVIAGIAVCGLCGVVKEKKYLVGIYSVIVTAIVTAEIIVAILFFSFGAQVELYIQGVIAGLVQDNYQGATLRNSRIHLSADSTGISDALDIAQVNLQCCGVTDYTDFLAASNWENVYSQNSQANITAEVPISCCKISNPHTLPADLASVKFVDVLDCITNRSVNSTHTASCYSTIRHILVEYSTISIVAGVAGLQICGVLAACLFICKTKDDDDDCEYDD